MSTEQIVAADELVKLSKQAGEIYGNIGRNLVTLRLTEKMAGMITGLASLQTLIKQTKAGEDVKAGVTLDLNTLEFAEKALIAVIAQESRKIARIFKGMAEVDESILAASDN